MTDKRYRPLAAGEVIEEGDQYHWDGDWFQTNDAGIVQKPHGMKRRRLIPEIQWRDPVGKAGYPYPPGTVVEVGSRAEFIIQSDGRLRITDPGEAVVDVGDIVYEPGDDCPMWGWAVRHRVIDYRPDLCEPQTDASEPQADLCGGGDTQDELTRLRAENERLQREVSKLNRKDELRKRYSENLPFCPDHRDKVKGLPCRECENERLRKQGSVYNGRSAEEWYTLYCQSVLASDAADDRRGFVLRDELPEYLL